MTKKISVSLPDDVAAFLEQRKNASAFVAEAVRLRMRAIDNRAVLQSAGFEGEPSESLRQRYEAGKRHMRDPEVRAAHEAWLEQRAGGA
jgi:hypothetical protein